MATPDDPYDMRRFVAAQSAVGPEVVEQLHEGRKAGHWMWFVFPQLRGLGASAMAEPYGVSGLAGVQADLAHPVLGARLREAAAPGAPSFMPSLRMALAGPEASTCLNR